MCWRQSSQLQCCPPRRLLHSSLRQEQRARAFTRMFTHPHPRLQQEHMQRVTAVWKKYNCHPLKSLGGMFVQARAAAGGVRARLQGMQGGGSSRRLSKSVPSEHLRLPAAQPTLLLHPPPLPPARCRCSSASSQPCVALQHTRRAGAGGPRGGTGEGRAARLRCAACARLDAASRLPACLPARVLPATPPTPPMLPHPPAHPPGPHTSPTHADPLADRGRHAVVHRPDHSRPHLRVARPGGPLLPGHH